ncbi:MAG: hypothetical protein AAFX05_02910 [Planctomycetota bacterium]
MKTKHRTLTLIAATLFAAHTASAQVIDCVCESTYEVGDRVVALVDDPSSANGLPSGSLGTVICGFSPGSIEILIRWDDWGNGFAENKLFCNCAVSPGGGTSGDWGVACAEIELFTPVTNITQGTDHVTIADGIATSNPGDVLELDAHTFTERGLILDNRDITIRGQGPDLTIIDGGSLAPRIFDFSNGDESTIEGVTIQNGLADSGDGGAAARVLGSGTSVTFDDVQFLGNDAGPLTFGALSIEIEAHATLKNCFFANNAAGSGEATDIGVLEGQLTAFNSVFGQSQTGYNNIYFQDGISPAFGLFINCSFGATAKTHHVIAFGPNAIVQLANCIFTASASDNLSSVNGSIILPTSSVFPNATGDNIDGVPTFVDPANGDYRLAPGSLGIDAANYDIYAAGGGELTDLAGNFRLSDDPGILNTGIGGSGMLDCGAFEFQSSSPSQAQCPGDLDNDGDTDLGDFTILASDFGCSPTP